MSNYFNADGPNRQTAFSYPNAPPEGIAGGDQGSQVHPVPAVLPPGQKVGLANGQQVHQDDSLYANSGRMGPGCNAPAITEY